MEIIAALGALTAIGYLNSGKKSKTRKISDNLVVANEKPNGSNIYDSDRAQQMRDEEYKASENLWTKSMNPLKNKVVGFLPGSNKEINNEVIRDKIPQGIRVVDVKYPSYQKAIEETSNNMIPIEYVERQGIETFNNKRNNMKNDGVTISKNIIQWETHNNMEPFFGGSIKQNMDPYAHETSLGINTGRDPTYRNKQEVGSFVAMEKQNVFGTQVPNDRQESRYIVSDYQQGVKPFQEVRVKPGLNQGYTENTTIASNVMDTYRPKVKNIDDLRITTRHVLKARENGGPYAYVQNRGIVPETVSRKYKDLSVTNFTVTDANLFEQSVQGKKVRDMIPAGGWVRNAVNDKDTVVLKNAERNNYGQKQGNFQGIASGNDETYTIGNYRENFKNTTSVPIINAGNEIGFYTYNPETWKLKITTRDENGENLHIRKGVSGPDARPMDVQDETRTTIKEQTMVENYMGVAEGEWKQRDRTDVYNEELNSLRVLTDSKRMPVKEGSKVANSKETFADYQAKKIQYNTVSLDKRPASLEQSIVGKSIIGNVTTQKQLYADAKYNINKLSSDFSDQFMTNPYKPPNEV